MIITNKHGLPEPLLRFARNDRYSKGSADYSVTELISPPQLAYLKNKHRKDQVVDVSEMIWPLLGTAVHALLETGAREEISEERIYTSLYGAVISGAMDIQKLGQGVEIVDYKVTSVFSAMSEKPDWESQLNCYAYLVEREKKLVVRRLSICAILRDWRRYEARTKPDYPERPVVMIDLPLWTMEERETFLRDRIAAHTHAAMCADMGEDLPACSDEETWLRGERWATHKPGAKRASAVFSTHAEARQYAEPRGLTVAHRPGERLRCAEFCVSAPWCKQHERQQKEQKDRDGGQEQEGEGADA